MPTRSKNKSVKIVEVPNVDQYGHKQPQSLDMEEAVLGALMIDQEAYALVAEILKPESFYDKRNQLIYKAIQELSTEQRPVDIMTVQDQLESNGELEEAGGTPYIMQINMKIGSPRNRSKGIGSPADNLQQLCADLCLRPHDGREGLDAGG